MSDLKEFNTVKIDPGEDTKLMIPTGDDTIQETMRKTLLYHTLTMTEGAEHI